MLALSRVQVFGLGKTSALDRLTELTYAAARDWLANPRHPRFFGWALRRTGDIATKATDSEVEVNDWFGQLGIEDFADVIYGLYWDDQQQNVEGVTTPADEFRPEIDAATLQIAVDAVSGASPPVPRPAPTPGTSPPASVPGTTPSNRPAAASTTPWAWIIGGTAVVFGAGVFLLRRKRTRTP